MKTKIAVLIGLAAMIIGLVLPPRIIAATPTVDVRIHVLYRYNDDGSGDKGVGSGIPVTLFYGDDVTVPTNEVSFAEFKNVPYGTYYVSAKVPKELFWQWICARFITVQKPTDTPQDNFILYCKRQWGIFLYIEVLKIKKYNRP